MDECAAEDEHAERHHSVGVQVDPVGEMHEPRPVHRPGLDARLHEHVQGPLQIDDPHCIPEGLVAVAAVHEPAHQLIQHVGAGEQRQLRKRVLEPVRQ